ncbi:hypothetical protein [Pontibacter akesuensis]|uniref:Uncharacterized protein n=1 Tax=Pontibacter akesuensis TaxID=388950 RepID=A0A1I7K7A5_9BACT|nr:hypothetical protein [Pontibacter akesuensis]GHA74551.1 hypothetical protein GCM10007389_30370 [Pontibacter akesuensis]SFU93315.1 hypothetical protein SAMN04487941_3470 [Pontibacter akesuensis]
MKNLYLLFVLLLAGCVPEQKSDTRQVVEVESTVKTKAECEKCPASNYAGPEPDTVFTFSNGKKLLICGYSEILDNRKAYSEFILSECGNDSIVDFWGAVEAYEVEYASDTLQLQKIELLAVGDNRTLVKEKWLTEYFYYKEDILQREKKLNSKIGYSQSQIEQTLQEYEHTQWKTQNGSSEAYTEEKMELANRLMIAAASGSGKAESYFKKFDSDFQPDGAYAEWYQQMADLLAFAKKYRTQE